MTAEELYERYKQRVFHLCWRYSGGRPAWAEDAAHDVFLRLFERLNEIDENDNVDGFIHRVTVNYCLSYCRREGRIWRKVRRKLEAETEHLRRPTNPLGKAERIQRAVIVREVLGKLSPIERAVFSMKHFEQMPQVEIATQLSLSNGYVSKVLQRAEKRVRKNLGTERSSR